MNKTPPSNIQAKLRDIDAALEQTLKDMSHKIGVVQHLSSERKRLASLIILEDYFDKMK